MILITVNPWPDLVYHGLAHLPVPAEDAASLFSLEYAAWYERQLQEAPPGDAGVPRSLAEDRVLLASLYARSDKGYLLHSLPCLWDGLEDFTREVKTSLDQIPWRWPGQAGLASLLRAHTQPELVDLFRIALWTEIQHGYPAVWENVMAPRARAYQDPFAQAMESLGQSLPGLQKVHWILCHSLRIHGRGWTGRGGEPVIAVGVADPELGVTPIHPVIQACHEYWVLAAGAQIAAGQEFDTVPGRPGYAKFHQVETAALKAGELFFSAGPLAPAYREWRARFSH